MACIRARPAETDGIAETTTAPLGFGKQFGNPRPRSKLDCHLQYPTWDITASRNPSGAGANPRAHHVSSSPKCDAPSIPLAIRSRSSSQPTSTQQTAHANNGRRVINHAASHQKRRLHRKPTADRYPDQKKIGKEKKGVDRVRRVSWCVNAHHVKAQIGRQQRTWKKENWPISQAKKIRLRDQRSRKKTTSVHYKERQMANSCRQSVRPSRQQIPSIRIAQCATLVLEMQRNYSHLVRKGLAAKCERNTREICSAPGLESLADYDRGSFSRKREEETLSAG